MKTSSQESETKKCSLTPNTFKLNATSVNIHECSDSCMQQKNELKKTSIPKRTSSGKTLKTSSVYNHTQPCPFTFLTAVKCKFPVNKSYVARNRTCKLDQVNSMDSIKPLNVPNLRISPNVYHVSEKIESSSNNLLASKKSDGSCKTKSNNTNEVLTERSSSTATRTLKSRNSQSLKSSSTVQSKGKILLKNNARKRDISNDQENRLKKIKKEDGSSVKSKNHIPSTVKSFKNQKHISRKDILDQVANKIVKNDKILSCKFQDSSNAMKKSVKTNTEKLDQPAKFPTKSHKEISVKSNTGSTESSVHDHQKNTNFNVDLGEDNNQVFNILNFNAKPSLLEYQNSSNSADLNSISEEYSEHLRNQKSSSLNQDSSMASVEKYQKSDLTAPPLMLSTTKGGTVGNLHIQHNNIEYISSVLSPNHSNQSSNDSIIETKLSQESLSEKLMDPIRISFREDSYSNQPEFTNLVTPNVNLTIRSKRRKQVIRYVDSDQDYQDSKLSKSDHSAVQGAEVRAKTESNTPDQSASAQKTASFTDGSIQEKATSNNTREKISDITTKSKSINTESQEIKSWSENIETESNSRQYADNTSLVFSKECTDPKKILHISLNSGDGYENVTRVEDICLSKKMRTMSEISLHETTSSIKTESGTEISISLRDVTCSFNKNLDLEMAQLIDDERQRYNKIEMLFKSREKSLNDRTRKLVKLEEQKKVLRDTGQDNRISSVKKKQRALLLKLQQEKEEMNRLKELHKIASQERKLMLQKQRDMFNPDMSTKNILHKLKRSADSQSPRRLSGPMKGYDIRSNSSISSLIDSDKSLLDRSKFDYPLNLSDIVLEQKSKTRLKLGVDNKMSTASHDTSFSKVEAQVKCDLRSSKFDEKMPKSDMKYQLYDIESVLDNGALELLKDDHASLSRSRDQNFIFENVRKKSNAFIEEFTEIWKSHFSQSKSEASAVDKSLAAGRTRDDIKVSKRKGLKLHKSKTLSVNSPDTFCQKSRSLESIDKKGKNHDEFNEILSKPVSVQELIKHSDLLKERNEELLKDIVDERNNFAKQSSGTLLSSREQERQRGELEEEEEIIEKSDNVSVQSHVSLAISHQSSNDSDKSYLKSVVIRSQQDYQPNSSLRTSKKLEQILKAREATLISRRNCVEEWIAWHARLRDEEERVSRMEKAAYKLVSATARTLSLNDTTVSSDNSDVEGRIELLTKKLADRRFEMTRLKKEARKQAKRRLRALEANLLTQIKRYDATINEMRKKLETKKGPNKEKLEIESKSVNDYKVPDIPIKNIQEIYKRSGLLRSDVDLVPINKDDEDKGESNDTEPSLSQAENSSAEKIKATASNIALDHEQKSMATESIYSQAPPEIQKSESSNSHKKDSNLSRSSNISESSLNKVSSLKKNSNANSQEISSHDSQDGSILSKKLSHIHLHNKELNDDIHNLENDLKELSELMMNFSKKSNDQNSVSVDSTRKTSAAIDELGSQDVSKQVDNSKLDIKSDTIATDLQIRVQEALSNGIPETDNISTSIEELYSEIKSKDNRLGQISHKSESPEKSFETEELHRMSKSLGAVDEKDYKNDNCSILEIISTTGEQDEEEIDELAHQPDASSLSHDSQNHLKIQEVNKDTRSTETISQKQSEVINQDHESSIQTSIKSDDRSVGLESEKIEAPKAQNSIENENQALPVESVNVADSDHALTELSLSSDKHGNSARKSIETRNAQDYDRHSISDVEDSTIFEPKGESTNLLDTFVLKLDSSSDVGIGICSEEFNDILEIIERETKNEDNILQETNVQDQVHREETIGQENTKSREIEKPTVEAGTIVDSDSNSVSVNDDAINAQLKDISEKVHQDENDSSDGEQTNNLIEVVENKLDMIQKSAAGQENNILADKPKTHVTVFLDKTLQVIRDPEYEDISEESLEVSDIFSNTNPAFHRNSKKQTTVPEKYIIKSETDQVLRILDEISNKSNKLDNGQQETPHDSLKDSPIETNLSTECSSNENVSPWPLDKPPKPDDSFQEVGNEPLVNSKNEITLNESSNGEEKQKLRPENLSSLNDDKKENLDTSADSRLDSNVFNENAQDALSLDEKVQDTTAEFRTTPMGVSSEKDIEFMIKKLKASLEQPGLEVAELEAKLLEIENLQIELAIKKLEAEEVSYYVREIPNKPPPPYTPPGSVIQTGSNGVPSSVSIIPTNIEELLLVTEKATAIIHVNKKSGEDVQLLEAPDEIYENIQEPDTDAVKKNRLIYNTFLFDLCKELVVDIYKVEEENPGPSWTRPQVKTKRVIKIPKSVNELNEYVSKEVATLFGFKTKLQRENMVMRWSRKRRDRVDELLAKEAQAEEKEWTKFHHDELAVKNELTVTILNNLLMETTSCIKNAYAKKRKLSVL